MKCKYCQAENRVGVEFCENCGRLLERDTSIMDSAPEEPTNNLMPGRALAHETIIFESPTGTRTTHRIETSLTLGRGPIDPAIAAAPFYIDDDTISRRHARIDRQGNRFEVVDLESTNGTFVNGRRLPPHQAYILRDGDELRLGQVQLTVVFPGVTRQYG